MELQLFNALFGCYFTTVYHILKEAGSRELTNAKYRDLIRKTAETYGFPEISSTLILDAITLGENEELEENKDAWPFFERIIKEEKSASSLSSKKAQYQMHKNKLQNISIFPLSIIEKMWLKSIYLNPRIELFIDDDFPKPKPKLRDVEPLFDWKDFVLFDRKEARLEIKFRKPDNTVSFSSDGTYEIEPKTGIGKLYIDTEYLEYSERDNKFRLIGNNPRFGRNMVNIASIVECREVEKRKFPNPKFPNAQSDNAFQSEVIFELFDSNNVLERFLLNFSHYEKDSEYMKESGKYRIKITYDKADETDLLIRTLSFGPHVKVLEPSDFVELIRERLRKQRDGT